MLLIYSLVLVLKLQHMYRCKRVHQNVITCHCCRPLCASGMDKLELQDCLEHGRVAKVVNIQIKVTYWKLNIFCHLQILRAKWLPFDSAYCLLVWESANHYYTLQFYQTGEGPALPSHDEWKGGHTVVHWAGEVRSKHGHIVPNSCDSLIVETLYFAICIKVFYF